MNRTSQQPIREIVLPSDKPPVPQAPPLEGRVASSSFLVSKLRGSSPTAATRPEMQAVRPNSPSYPGVIPIEQRPSWIDPDDDDPVTEQTGRPTDVGALPASFERRDRAVLLRMDGVHAGQVVSLDKDLVTIGRHSDNDLVIDDTGVSRYHARIMREGNQYQLIDLGARNGTVVQGLRAPFFQLHDGDFVQLGPRVSFRYSLTDSKQEKLLHKLYESSNRDSLTGAYNRRHFDERLLSEVAYSVRHGSPCALIVFDIDHFKRVNDTFGHAAGDAVLRQTAGIVRSRLRTEDVFARVGGEEFAILLRGVNLPGCVRLAERLRTSISAVPALYEGKTIGVSVSLGCATLECTGGSSPDEIVRLADERLYRAKASGRNRTVSS